MTKWYCGCVMPEDRPAHLPALKPAQMLYGGYYPIAGGPSMKKAREATRKIVGDDVRIYAISA
jgi:hypothetical protein